MQPETNFHTHAHMQQSYQICNQLVNNEQIPSPNLSIKSLMRAVEGDQVKSPPKPSKGGGGSKLGSGSLKPRGHVSSGLGQNKGESC